MQGWPSKVWALTEQAVRIPPLNHAIGPASSVRGRDEISSEAGNKMGMQHDDGPKGVLVNQRHLNPGQEQSRGAANAAIQPSFPRILAEDQGKPTDWAWVGTEVVFDGKKRG